jgi:hypothetical protein
MGRGPAFHHAMTTRNEGLSNADFDRLRALIYRESGINLSSDKKTMMEIRIKRRLHSLVLRRSESIAIWCLRPKGRNTNSST